MQIDQLRVRHNFVVVQDLVTPAILGIDFLQRHGLVLDFACTPISIRPSETQAEAHEQLRPMLEAHRRNRSRVYVIATLGGSSEDDIDECAIPDFRGPMEYDVPECPQPSFMSTLDEFKDLFKTTPGKTNLATHFIPTTGSPAKVPPRRIPAHFREEIELQIQTMLEQQIIEVSSSPWMAPAVFNRKKSGAIRICVDYRELNKRTKKDAYPLPLPNEVQDRLAGSTIFLTLDLQCGYWQLPVNPSDREKTAFSPGPGMGLYQFRRMPFGLTGAPGLFQRLMDRVMRGLQFVVTYMDDVLVHSADATEHQEHLRQAFQRLSDAGLTLRGKKCHFAMSEVTYLGHVFSESGMAPDRCKVKAVLDWAAPTDVTTVRQFLGLVSYYRRYIHQFAAIAAPLQ